VLRALFCGFQFGQTALAAALDMRGGRLPGTTLVMLLLGALALCGSPVPRVTMPIMVLLRYCCYASARDGANFPPMLCRKIVEMQQQTKKSSRGGSGAVRGTGARRRLCSVGAMSLC
jgi:hypothetical protein